jgi:hypothetical protein
VAVHNLTEEDRVTNSISAQTCHWVVAREGLASLMSTVFTKWANVYKVTEMHHLSSFQCTYCNHSIDTEIHVEAYPRHFLGKQIGLQDAS